MKSSLNSEPTSTSTPPIFVTERERPGKLLRPVALQDMQIGAANAGRRRLSISAACFGIFRPWHVANNRPRARAVIGTNTNLFHENSPALRRLLIAGRGWTETYVKPVALPMYGLRGLAAQLTGPSRPPEVAPTSIGDEALRNLWVIAVLFVVRLTWLSSFKKRCRGRTVIGWRVRR